MTALEEWIPTQLDPARGVNTIQLAAEGAVWETWGAPWPKDPAEVVGWAKAVIAANAADCRKGRVNLLFTALGADGQVRSTSASFCMGTNSAVDSLVGSGGGSAKAFSDSMQGAAALMNTLLASSKQFVEQVVRANESLTKQLVDLEEFKRAVLQAEVVAKTDDDKVPDFIVQQIKELAPQAQAAFALWMDSQQAKSLAAKATQKGIAAVAQINGAKS